MDKLKLIQSELKAPKAQRNTFGNYNYRSCEDILEALKPLLKQHDCLLTISDTIEAIGNRIYVKATATFTHDKFTIQTTAYAREASEKKGMDEAQITGSASSYARKYCLNGMFAIDDTKDADATNEHETKPPVKNLPEKEIGIKQKELFNWLSANATARGIKPDDILKKYGISKISELTDEQVEEIFFKYEVIEKE